MFKILSFKFDAIYYIFLFKFNKFINNINKFLGVLK